MLTRRRFVGYSALSSSMLACSPLVRSAFSQTSSTQRPLRLAILGSTYRRGSNLQTIADRFLVGYPLEGDWHMQMCRSSLSTSTSVYAEPPPHPLNFNWRSPEEQGVHRRSNRRLSRALNLQSTSGGNPWHLLPRNRGWRAISVPHARSNLASDSATVFPRLSAAGAIASPWTLY
ncbi:MAG: hypothetical protein JWQ49_4366 [Edaphobacter sp.]|nr:hypothetical protein [Edaphobacter sp.]